MKAYSIFSGSALLCAALLSSSLILSARTSSAETLPSQSRQQIQPTENSFEGNLGEKLAAEEAYVVPPANYVATAYSLRGRTASGRPVAKGIIAADPRHLPLGSRVRLEAGAYSGEYLVADTGSLVRGRRIDIWTPSTREAMRFGRRTVKLTVLSLGSRRRATNN
ncbi:MAG TPA: 3D domain-containing protein [Pyrinomonadaceae bacterium]|nr:3D domain-containing protein [Pyrinomonadaceae bacterium]